MDIHGPWPRKVPERVKDILEGNDLTIADRVFHNYIGRRETGYEILILAKAYPDPRSIE